MVSFWLKRLWNKRITIGEVLVKLKVEDNMQCCFLNSAEIETFEHLFIACAVANKL